MYFWSGRLAREGPGLNTGSDLGSKLRFVRSHSNLITPGQALSALLAEARAEADGGVDRPLVTPRARMRKLSDVERTGLARDYLRGMTVYQLAEKVLDSATDRQ
ncbi:hypothetical protein C5F51_22455 [Nocardia nova]|uniref:Uncharacterized protein n=1 Tax=Nocardia nova TaxID=37330 RepID=A0A2S6A1Z7_9NOCA|nr:hypothetical protein C5F51_22455 [Nocardia nova]